MENNISEHIKEEYIKLSKMSIEERINYIKEHTIVLNSHVEHELSELPISNKGNKKYNKVIHQREKVEKDGDDERRNAIR